MNQLRFLLAATAMAVASCSSSGNSDGAGGSAGANSGGSAGAAGSATGGQSMGGAAGMAGGGPIEFEYPTLDCDPIAPDYCPFPFPSNVYTRVDDTTPTGRRLAVSNEAAPTNIRGVRGVMDPINVGDGFSVGAEMITHLPGATETGLPTPDTIGRSLEDDSPTVLIEAESLERVAHFSELDARTADQTRKTFAIRPVQRLKNSTRYIVAIRNVVDSGGQPVAPSPVFQALRDGTDLPSEPSVESRRDLYTDIFGRLTQAGVDPASLQQAWDFTTASREDNTNWMLHMRDEAFGIVGDQGPEYIIDSVDTDWETARVAFRIFGRMIVPLYLTDPAPGTARLVFGQDGMPDPNPNQATFEVPFEMIIPKSAETTPAPVIQYGHGLFGTRRQIEAGNFLDFMNTYNYAFVGIDLIGMSDDDPVAIGAIILTGQVENIASMFERLHQGMLNQLLATEMATNRLADDPMFAGLIDKSRTYYHGISQGGIFGPTYVALSPRVTRGVMGVMGQPYNLLLSRSVDFEAFMLILQDSYEDPRDIEFFLALTQGMWDRVEPTGYSAYMDDPLPGSPPNQILMRAALGDHQVTTLGAHHMARSAGAVHVDTGIRDIWGLDKVANSTSGSAYVEYDFGLPPEPLCNVPMTLCSDPHGKIRRLDEANSQMDHFLRTGEVRNDCAGACSFPTQSGCGPGEDQIDLCP